MTRIKRSKGYYIIDFEYTMTDDTQATLLLCAHQGGEYEHQPLGVPEYNRVATVLHQSQLRPQDLLASASVMEVSEKAGIRRDRLEWLLDRKINLGFKLEHWQRNGFWVLSRSDPHYPFSLRSTLGNLSPPLIFGIGDQDLVSDGGVAIVGPDSIPTSRVQKSCHIAERVVKQKKTVIVIGSSTLSKQIVRSVLMHAGKIIWILFDGQLRQRLKKSCRLAIQDDHLVMVTTQSPSAPKGAGKKELVASIATGLADQLLYVDGSNSKNQSKRTDQYNVLSSVMKHVDICNLFVGRTISPEGRQLKERGTPLWKDSSSNLSGKRDLFTSPQ